MLGSVDRAFFMMFDIFILEEEFVRNFALTKKQSMKNLLILFIVVFVQASCGQSTETTRSAEKFKEEIANPDVILLDVRTPEEFAEDEKTMLTALVIALMDKTAERVGNEESASESKHFGVTGFQKKHVVGIDGNQFIACGNKFYRIIIFNIATYDFTQDAFMLKFLF